MCERVVPLSFVMTDTYLEVQTLFQALRFLHHSAGSAEGVSSPWKLFAMEICGAAVVVRTFLGPCLLVTPAK